MQPSCKIEWIYHIYMVYFIYLSDLVSNILIRASSNLITIEINNNRCKLKCKCSCLPLRFTQRLANNSDRSKTIANTTEAFGSADIWPYFIAENTWVEPVVSILASKWQQIYVCRWRLTTNKNVWTAGLGLVCWNQGVVCPSTFMGLRISLWKEIFKHRHVHS